MLEVAGGRESGWWVPMGMWEPVIVAHVEVWVTEMSCGICCLTVGGMQSCGSRAGHRLDGSLSFRSTYHSRQNNYRNAWCRFYLFELIKTVMTII